ncbi:ATPase [Polynucleobacter sp. SHI8]|uniref:ATP-binding protein n=1 Tax=unclassified Polynucleobacter TaxID=2640945 RepID=UPI00248F78CC|nr:MULTISPECIES: ATP-binding protein [unclassified Polynucleobacter]BDW10237.1 ATPase [Polynucleobacter sp. SHI2]BDW12683.1 ATPase [Polynucleobacter sp. SHI8]
MNTIDRYLKKKLLKELEYSPAVVLLGPRQVGKTTLAFDISNQFNAVYLDLESESDRAKLEQPELYLEDHKDQLIILDEVQRTPGLFPNLRGVIDKRRRAGKVNGSFLLLGSASFELLKQSSESLAGRVAYLELDPINIIEVSPSWQDNLWVRGGFPNSLLAVNNESSLLWRKNFIRTYIERDIPQLGFNISSENLRRFWTMLCHHQGCPMNSSELSRSLGINVKTVNAYLDLLVDLMLVRKLQPWHTNLGKRISKTPKVMIRDSGIVHALLNIKDKESLLSNPILGNSWECFVIENLLSCLPKEASAYYYRSSGGAEIDLLLNLPDGKIWAIEIKRSLKPKLERGFYSACEDVKPSRKFVVYPGEESYRIAEDIDVISLSDLANQLISLDTYS